MEENIYIKSLLDIPEQIYMEDFLPLGERLKGTDLEEAYNQLSTIIDREAFEHYFERLINIKKHNQDLLIVTYSENHRAIILREYIGIVKEVFGVTSIRIVVQNR